MFVSLEVKGTFVESYLTAQIHRVKNSSYICSVGSLHRFRGGQVCVESGEDGGTQEQLGEMGFGTSGL